MGAKTLPADVCFFGRFGWLSPAAVHSADCRFYSGWSGGSIFHPLSHIYTITPFCCIETVAMLWIVDVLLFLINWEQTQHPLSTQLSHREMFMQNVEYTAFWYPQLLCYLMQLQFMISQTSLWSFLVFSKTSAEFGWPERSASFLSVQPRLKSLYHLLTVVS